MISKERLNHLAFIGLLIGVLALMFFILLPYFNVFILAGTLAIIFYPLYRKITEAVKKEWLAALMTVVLVIAIFLLPLIFFGFQILKEAGQLYADIAGNSNNAGLVTRVSDSLQKSFNAIGPGISFDFDQMIKQTLTWMLGQIGNIFSEITQVTLGFLLSMLALYYLLKDGSKLIKTLIRISPLKDVDDQKILNTLKTAVQSVVLGSLTIAIIQGVLAGIGLDPDGENAVVGSAGALVRVNLLTGETTPILSMLCEEASIRNMALESTGETALVTHDTCGLVRVRVK